MALRLEDGVMWYSVFLFSTVCHEAAHAWSALRLGDDTASRGGQVSLSPWPHVRREPLGMVVMPIVSWLAGGWLFGWASAPYDPAWARRWPRRSAMMALAGPGANLALCALAALLMRVGLEWGVFVPPYSLSASHIVSAAGSHPAIFFAANLLSVFFSLNLLLCLFNLMPIPPLDGSSLPLLFLPESAARRYFEFTRSPILLVAGLVFISRELGAFFPPVLSALAHLLYAGQAF